MNLTISLFDKWQLLMREIESPQSFIDYGFYYLISAALQRRVWLPFGTVDLFPNQYIILTGPPAIGKGRVITQIKALLESQIRLKENVRQEDIADAESPEQMVEACQNFVNQSNDKKTEDPMEMHLKQLFPILPDSSSLRALTNFVANCMWSTRYKNHEGKIKPYAHSSCAFILEELFNLFKEQKETKDISRFLTCAWDCNDYRHYTHGAGKDVVKKMCVCLLAGTTPDFMRNVVGNDLMNEGFASRTLFIWGDKNRHHRFDFGHLDAEQLQARRDLQAHLKTLSNLCGPLNFAPDAYDFAKNWYEEVLPDVRMRVSQNYKMDHYYGRKKMHLLKMAMSCHFARSFDLNLELEDLQEALKILNTAEPTMHIALGGKGRNELAGIGATILTYLKRHGSMTSSQLLFEFADEVTKQELAEILEMLVTTRQLESKNSGPVAIFSAVK